MELGLPPAPRTQGQLIITPVSPLALRFPNSPEGGVLDPHLTDAETGSREVKGLAETGSGRNWHRMQGVGFSSLGLLASVLTRGLWTGERIEEVTQGSGLREKCGCLGSLRGWGNGGTSGLTFQTPYLSHLNAFPCPWGPPQRTGIRGTKGTLGLPGNGQEDWLGFEEPPGG